MNLILQLTCQKRPPVFISFKHDHLFSLPPTTAEDHARLQEGKEGISELRKESSVWGHPSIFLLSLPDGPFSLGHPIPS